MTGRSANLLFVEVNRLGLQDQERISLFSLYRSGQAFRLHWERFYGMERPLLEVVPAPKRSNPGYTVQDRFLHTNRHIPIGYLFIYLFIIIFFFQELTPKAILREWPGLITTLSLLPAMTAVFDFGTSYTLSQKGATTFVTPNLHHALGYRLEGKGVRISPNNCKRFLKLRDFTHRIGRREGGIVRNLV